MLLTKQERERFIEYCKQAAMSHTALSRQLGKLAKPNSIEDHLRLREHDKSRAYTMVALDLESVDES